MPDLRLGAGAYNVPVIHLLHGPDSYRKRQALDAIRAELATPDGMLESNTTVLPGDKLTPQELLAAATAVPFLAPARLVIVEGLIETLAKEKPSRGKKKAADRDDPLAPWRQAATQLADPAVVPTTTTLVFVEGAVRPDSTAFKIVAGAASARDFPLLARDALLDVAAGSAKARGLKMNGAAIGALVDASGPDLWALHTALDKIEAFAPEGETSAQLVSDLVGTATETKIWDLTDAIIAGNDRKATTSLARLLAEGQPAPLIASIIASQYRRLVVVKDMTEQRVPKREIARTIDPGKAREYMVDRPAAAAQRYSWATLRASYQKMLDADLNVKRGLQDDESSLQLLVHELCALAPAATAGRPAYAR